MCCNVTQTLDDHINNYIESIARDDNSTDDNSIDDDSITDDNSITDDDSINANSEYSLEENDSTSKSCDSWIDEVFESVNAPQVAQIMNDGSSLFWNNSTFPSVLHWVHCVNPAERRKTFFGMD